jgi:hypothetical protein
MQVVIHVNVVLDVRELTKPTGPFYDLDDVLAKTRASLDEHFPGWELQPAPPADRGSLMDRIAYELDKPYQERVS